MIQLIWNDKTVALKSPDFEDTLGLRTNVIAKRSMNNTLYTFVSPNRDRIRTFNFQNLSRRQARNYFNFMRAARGKDITMIDHDGQRWFGVIVNPPQTQHAGINNSTMTFTFEGVQVA